MDLPSYKTLFVNNFLRIRHSHVHLGPLAEVQGRHRSREHSWRRAACVMGSRGCAFEGAACERGRAVAPFGPRVFFNRRFLARCAETRGPKFCKQIVQHRCRCFFSSFLVRNNSNSASACNGVRSMSRALAVFQNCNSYWRYYCICNCCGALQPHFFFVFRCAIVGAAIFAMQMLLRFCQHCNCSLGDSCECKRCGGSVCTCGSPSKTSDR